MRLRRDEVSVRNIGDETIVLNLETSRYLTVTGVGVRIFEELSGGVEVSIEQLVKVIVDEYEVSHDVARRDIESFIDALRHASLLES